MKNYNQVNFLQGTSSDNINYDNFKTSSRFDSFSSMVGNGVIIEYKQTVLFSDVVTNNEKLSENKGT